jgi:hypothetical protein
VNAYDCGNKRRGERLNAGINIDGEPDALIPTRLRRCACLRVYVSARACDVPSFPFIDRLLLKSLISDLVIAHADVDEVIRRSRINIEMRDEE